MPIITMRQNLTSLIMPKGRITVFWSKMMFLVTLPIMLASMPSMANDDVTRAETWFNKIRTISADFVQVASDGTSAEGRLAFRRPSRMKITYGKGDELQLITSSVWLHVDRPDERLLTSYPISETPLSLILADKVSLRLDGYETRVLPSIAGIVRIEIGKDDGEGAGRLTLEFSEKPFQFRRWIILDAAGIETSVTLQNIVFDQPIANEAFKIPDYSAEN
ncbi:outer membrane lipoprotein carrier protein LolA [Alphaproteobacteria bacterium]|jgi:outer membrane lipoprotein-sorting protein|nr:outer membrane lipoprotein carrier protein LolA [Alphaproteobacteria bacterium]MDA8872188.1 outer membrane lipoprotein carrier protein LolA [Alphaproteobacteria bacterium]MDA9824456.1 outer membrane lipoprotein carrier protein LolA [Alphaproteobacteria bacterium]MDG2489740.1 outer membrane lipoprotein carrier protein LolA [Alphaproteobacteria bacterium]